MAARCTGRPSRCAWTEQTNVGGQSRKLVSPRNRKADAVLAESGVHPLHGPASFRGDGDFALGRDVLAGPCDFNANACHMPAV